MDALLRYHWNFYSELAYQRKQVDEELRDSLNQNCTSDYVFSGWQRAVRYRYGLHPLCTIGSTFDPGGRFNIGDIAPQSSPCLALAYPSKFTGKMCLAIFPHNFQHTSSYISIDDPPPLPHVPTRVDATNWAICELTAEEALALSAGKN